MSPLSEKDRLLAALRIARDLHDNPKRAEQYPSGTCISPVGIENGTLYVAIKAPEEATSMQMERIAC